MSRGRAARLVSAFAVALIAGLAVLSAFGSARSGDGWLALAALAAPAVLAVALADRKSTAGFVITIGFAAVLGLFVASLVWDFQREREHPVILFAIATAPFMVLPMIPVAVAAQVRDLLLRRPTP